MAYLFLGTLRWGEIEHISQGVDCIKHLHVLLYTRTVGETVTTTTIWLL